MATAIAEACRSAPLLARAPRTLFFLVLCIPPALRELRERLRDRILVRQDIEHATLLERGLHDLLVESGGDIDAAVGDAVVVRRRRGQPFGALFLRAARRQRVQRNGGIVVHPQHAPGIVGGAVATNEAAGRRGAVVAWNRTQRELGNAGCRMITDGRTEQRRCRAAQLALAAEDQHLRRRLVHDRKWIALVVLAGDDPAGQFDNRFGHALVRRKFINGGYRWCRCVLVPGVGDAAARNGQRRDQCGMQDAACGGGVGANGTTPWQYSFGWKDASGRRRPLVPDSEVDQFKG